MISITDIDIARVEVEEQWNFSDSSELLMHSIHSYPAKFPAFIATKAFEYAEDEGVNVNSVADIFCGCGTVALEAKLHKKDFWGYDINPVATLIAKAKSENYDVKKLENFFSKIKCDFEACLVDESIYETSNRRIQYWFTVNSFNSLYKLRTSIQRQVKEEKYIDAYLCLFSSILKSCSKWLTKSIKPQVDPHKKEADVWGVFEKQHSKFIRAVNQLEGSISKNVKTNIKTANFLMASNLPNVDLIISSPPYVTSYEYADLHQLSTLWLQYVDDYRELRKGSIGSAYNSEYYVVNLESLNSVGKEILTELMSTHKATAQIRSIARYYTDMQRVINKCANMLNDGGMVFLVVGDTEYKGVQIKNSEHLIECLRQSGFTDIKAAKRRISNKLLTPYRDKNGRFSSDKSNRTIYHEEFIISGRMWK